MMGKTLAGSDRNSSQKATTSCYIKATENLRLELSKMVSEGQFHTLPVYFVFETAEAAERWKNTHFPNVLLQHCSDSVSHAPFGSTEPSLT